MAGLCSRPKPRHFMAMVTFFLLSSISLPGSSEAGTFIQFIIPAAVSVMANWPQSYPLNGRPGRAGGCSKLGTIVAAIYVEPFCGGGGFTPGEEYAARLAGVESCHHFSVPDWLAGPIGGQGRESAALELGPVFEGVTQHEHRES